MPKLFDRVKVNIATTGTGDVTFGAVSSNAFLTPSEAGCADGDTVRYVIVDGTDFEEGIGTIGDSVTTMARTTVTKSKIGGTAGTTKLDLSGTAVLVLVASAADIVNKANVTTVGNALLTAADAAAAQTAAGASAVGKAIFTAEDEDAAQDAAGASAVGKALFTATDAAAARSASGAAASGANSDITSLSALTNATLQASPANPTLTTSSTAVMMGLGGTCKLTPGASGRIRLQFEGTLNPSLSGTIANVQARYGTGTAPSNGAAATGTAIGGIRQGAFGSANTYTPFSAGGIITGLTPGTAYWFDLSIFVTGGGNLSVFNISCSAMEF